MTTWGWVGSGWWPMQGTSWPVRQSMAASRSRPSRSIWRRWLGASWTCSRATRASVPSARAWGTVVMSNSAGSGPAAVPGWVMWCSLWVGSGAPAGCAGGGVQGADGVGGDLVQRVGGVVDDGDAVGLDRQWRGADGQVDDGDAVAAQPVDLLHAGSRVVPAAVGEQVREAGAARVGHLERVGGEGDRVGGERAAAAGADARHPGERPAAVAEQAGAVAEQGDGAAPVDLA